MRKPYRSSKKVSRIIRAQMRDIKVLLNETKGAIFLFLAILLVSSLLLYSFYITPETKQHLTIEKAVYASFNLIFFENILILPENSIVQVLFYIIPILGLFAIADGILNFGVALFNKQSRGQKWQAAMASTYHNHIVVCGIGKLGYRVIQELIKLNRDIVAIDNNPDGRFIENAQNLGIPIIIGDARRPEYLLKANVSSAVAIIPCTDNELANLDIALDAREINPDIRVVMRMFDPDLAKRIEKGFGIHTAFSSSALTAPIFAAAALDLNVKHSFYLNNTLLNIGEIIIQVQSRFRDWTIEKFSQTYDISVVCYQKGDYTDLHPEPGLKLEEGVRLLVLTSLEKLETINELR